MAASSNVWTRTHRKEKKIYVKQSEEEKLRKKPPDSTLLGILLESLQSKSERILPAAYLLNLLLDQIKRQKQNKNFTQKQQLATAKYGCRGI